MRSISGLFESAGRKHIAQTQKQFHLSTEILLQSGGRLLCWTRVNDPARGLKGRFGECRNTSLRSCRDASAEMKKSDSFGDWQLSSREFNLKNSVRFGMKQVLVLVTLCALALVFFQCLVTWLRSLDQEYRILVSLDCKNGREINIYVDSFCDYRTIPVYEVTIDGEIVMNKYSINRSFDCGKHIRTQDFRIKWDESNTLVAVSYKDEVVLVYDFERRAGWPSPNGYRSSDLIFKKLTQ